MTYPGQGDQFGQPQQPQPQQPQWQQPQPPQQQWPQPDWQQQQQWQQPGYPQTGPQPTQQWQPTAQYGQMPPQGPPGKGKRGLIIGLVVALIALVGGGVTWLALSLSGSSGAASPGEAAGELVAAVEEGDLIGLMDALPPAEANVLSDMVASYVEELKRIEVLDSSADARNVTGVEVEVSEELKFDDSRARKINDHLTMAALTDGTLTINGKFNEIPLAQSFKDAIMPPGAQAQMQQQNPSETVDIGEFVRQSGKPIYIATVNVDGEWYPSLFHTIADQALTDEGEQWPATPTPAVGASSPNEAIKALVEAVRTTDIQKVIEIMPPDEMAVLHDLGPLIIQTVNEEGDEPDAPFQVTQLETEQSEVDGGTRNTVTDLELSFTDDGQPHTFTLHKDGDCYTGAMDGKEERVCQGDIAEKMRQTIPQDIPPGAVEPAIEIVEALYEENFGVITTEVDGKHYVSPLRTYSDFGLTFLKAVKPEHVKQLLELIPR